MKNYIYYLLSVVVLAVSGWYNGVYRATMENVVYAQMDHTAQAKNAFLSRFVRSLENEVGTEVRICGDSTKYIQKISIQIDSVMRLHGDAISSLQNLREIRETTDSTADFIYEKFTQENAAKLMIAHDSLYHNLRVISDTYDARKIGLQPIINSVYEQHFTKIRADFKHFLPSDQHLWLLMERENAEQTRYRLQKALLDFMNPKYENEVGYKIMAYNWTNDQTYKIGRPLALFFKPLVCIKSMPHNRIDYYIADKKMVVHQGCMPFVARFKTADENQQPEIKVYDSIVKSNRVYYSWVGF
jgi:hypothetical protein